ncbi:MAG: hypothetical protein WCP29_08400 [Acidobacteriota bacterium]
MRRVAHLMWFDVLAQRVPLAVWAAVLLVEAALFYYGPVDAAGLGTAGRVGVTLGMPIIRLVATVVIVALFVHVDSTIGTTAFWRTRPIPRLFLLASKLCSTAIWMVLTPGVVTAGVLLLLGAHPADAVAGGTITCSEQAVMVFVALPLAILTKDLVQLIVGAVVALGIALVANQTMTSAFATWPALGGATALWWQTVLPAVAIGVVSAVVVYQYVTFRLRHSFVALACLLALTSVRPAPGYRPASSAVPPPWPAAVSTDVVSAEEVELSAAADSQISRPAVGLVDGGRQPRHAVMFDVVTTREPVALMFDPVEITTTLKLPDRSTGVWVRRWPTWGTAGNPVRATDNDQPYRSIRQALGTHGLLFAPYTTRRHSRIVVCDMTDEQHRRYRGQTARLDANVTMLAYRQQVVAALPLTIGTQTGVDDVGSMSIVSVGRTATGITVGLRETLIEHLDSASTAPVFVLRHAGRKLALMGSRRYERSSQYTTGFNFNLTRVVNIVSELLFAVPGDPGDGARVGDDWLKHAELVRVDAKLVGSITRPLRLEPFVVAGDAAPAGDQMQDVTK